MITYETIVKEIKVKLEGKLVGHIVSFGDGWFYKPKGGSPGETFATIEEVKRSLESD